MNDFHERAGYVCSPVVAGYALDQSQQTHCPAQAGGTEPAARQRGQVVNDSGRMTDFQPASARRIVEHDQHVVRPRVVARVPVTETEASDGGLTAPQPCYRRKHHTPPL
ncbi:hypothetical protein [Paraburkholderia sp. RL17-373-BIF-A]|uniref:hypothetical protein n=1 Tax=Paraburkholderia sp. RL17-373-BIF-A TaxID=3031629 RepID=UPI0038BB99E1